MTSWIFWEKFEFAANRDIFFFLEDKLNFGGKVGFLWESQTFEENGISEEKSRNFYFESVNCICVRKLELLCMI